MFGVSASASTTNTSSSGSSAENSKVRRLSEADEAFVSNLMRNFSAGGEADLKGARANALKDVKGSINNLFSEFSNTVLPQIMTQQNRTGGYNSSTSQLLTNDAFARTVAQGASLTMDAVSRYENAALAKSAQALQGFGTSLDALLNASQTSSTTLDSKSKSRSTTFSAGASFGI
jgi:hypothetical protein